MQQLSTYHCHAKIIKRGVAKSAIASAAYRAGERLRDELTGEIEDYTAKKGITHTEILLPDGAPEEYADRQTLWTAVERAERRGDAQLAREYEIALPNCLTHDERVSVVRDFVKDFVEQGMCADIAIEDTGHNAHAHIMLTMRDVTTDGFGKKNRSWNAPDLLLKNRNRFAEIQNQHLKKYGLYVSHESYAEQDKDKSVIREARPYMQREEYAEYKAARQVVKIARQYLADVERELEKVQREIWIAEGMETLEIKTPTLDKILERYNQPEPKPKSKYEMRIDEVFTSTPPDDIKKAAERALKDAEMTLPTKDTTKPAKPDIEPFRADKDKDKDDIFGR